MLDRNFLTHESSLGSDTSQTGTLYSGVLINSGVLYSGVLFRNPNEINEALCVCVQEQRELLMWTSFILSFMPAVYTPNNSKLIYIISFNSPRNIPGKIDFIVTNVGHLFLINKPHKNKFPPNFNLHLPKCQDFLVLGTNTMWYL